MFIPRGLQKFKLNLFERIGKKVEAAGGIIVRHDEKLLDELPDDIYPIIGCSPEVAPYYKKWQASGRKWIGWDRGYLRRVFATWLPKAESLEKSYYRWHIGSYQLSRLRDVPDDRWRALRLGDCVCPWRKGGKRIIIADTLPDYWTIRNLPISWSHDTAAKLKTLTDRPIKVREKASTVSLQDELKNAHCLVTHGSIAAVEAAIMGCPVFVAPESAAAHVGNTNFEDIENPIYPDRFEWLKNLAYSQWNEFELTDGTMWRQLEV